MVNLRTFLQTFPTSIEEMQTFRKLTSLWQELIFYGVLRGYKKAMDLWVPSENFEKFRNFCNQNGLSCFFDVKFVKPKDRSVFEKSTGAKHLTTTKTFAEPPETATRGDIHCFISRSKKNAKNLYQYGWYPAVSWDRVVYKNYQDLIEFGHGLGYPECCVDFFFQKNDWAKHNFPYEIFSRSTQFDFRCNPFWKDLGFSYIYHMPCSFSCAQTQKVVEKTRKSLAKEDPDTEKIVAYLLKLPILSIREQKVYAFEGSVLPDGSIAYSSVYRLGSFHEGDIVEFLKLGDRISVRENRFITVTSNDAIVFEYDSAGASQIEKPFIVQFV